MDYDDLLARCESEIESHLLGALYPNLGPDAQKEIEAQHIIDYYDMPATPESRETAVDAKGNAAGRGSIRSGTGRGGGADDTV